MAIKYHNPTTPGQRGHTSIDYSHLTTNKPEKSLVKGMKRHAGRNSQGKITTRHQGGGSKRLYRQIDFSLKTVIGIPGVIKTIEYDPFRTSFISLVFFKNGKKAYILTPDGMKVGDSIITEPKAKIKVGNRVLVSSVPEGYQVHNVELAPGKGGQIVRSAGSSAKIVSQEGERTQIMLPSGEVRLIRKDCYCTIGIVSNLDHMNVKIGKAGRSRNMGIRPTVRGSAMNPVDHPHGGGEGHQPIGLKSPKTPWGRVALGLKTRKRKYSDRDIVSRKKKKK